MKFDVRPIKAKNTSVLISITEVRSKKVLMTFDENLVDMCDTVRMQYIKDKIEKSDYEPLLAVSCEEDMYELEEEFNLSITEHAVTEEQDLRFFIDDVEAKHGPLPITMIRCACCDEFISKGLPKCNDCN